MSEVRFERGARPGDAGAGAVQGGESPWPGVHVGGDLDRARKEWLHTNGAGAYASSTLACMHTRRYHGLLVAALDPPAARHVFLSHVDATVTLPRGASPAPASRPWSRPSWGLAKHQFPGVDPANGPFHLARFDQDPLPRWTYLVPGRGPGMGGALEITLALVRGENAVVLRYVWRGSEPVELTLRPLLAARRFHELQREHGGMVQRVELRPGVAAAGEPNGAPPASAPGEMRVQPRRELPRVCFRYEGTFVGSPDWWRRFEYLAERDRGLPYEEDLWTPGVFEMSIDDRPRWLVAGVEKLPQGEPDALLEAARAALLAEDPGPPATLVERRLTIAAETFRADLARRPGVIAGYPWFEVWGRDALAALPGLYLVPKKYDGAIRVLRGLIGAMKDGLVPSRLPEAGAASNGDGGPPPSRARFAGSPEEPYAADAPSYAGADATLWLFEAARHVADALGDTHPFVADELLPALRDAFEATLRGAANGVHVTADGLLAAGSPGDAVTWMAARVGGKPVTSRAGCPVELSALWASACDTLARLARAAGDATLEERAEEACRRCRAAFADRFWCEATGYPFDVVSEARDGAGAFRDASIRPNAVVALAVDPDIFTPEQAASLLDRARRELVTRAGLRTLAPSDASYVGRYGGGPAARDAAYHQGTAWPWLLGFYVRAVLQSGAGGADLASELESLVASAAWNELAVGLTPELADGDPPHGPGGCVAQALSVAELLRALAWDLPHRDA
jgi:glycogen debranching enzyme